MIKMGPATYTITLDTPRRRSQGAADATQPNQAKVTRGGGHHPTHPIERTKNLISFQIKEPQEKTKCRVLTS